MRLQRFLRTRMCVFVSFASIFTERLPSAGVVCTRSVSRLTFMETVFTPPVTLFPIRTASRDVLLSLIDVIGTAFSSSCTLCMTSPPAGKCWSEERYEHLIKCINFGNGKRFSTKVQTCIPRDQRRTKPVNRFVAGSRDRKLSAIENLKYSWESWVDN